MTETVKRKSAKEKQKNEENFYVCELARRLGVNWEITPSESPDFIVSENGHQFGIEVSQVFRGPISKKGSKEKRAEGEIERMLKNMSQQYETKRKITLIIKFLGDIKEDDTETLYRKLDELDLKSQRNAVQKRLDIRIGLKVFVTKSFRSSWFLMNHQTGWVQQNANNILCEAIKDKSKNIKEYTKKPVLTYVFFFSQTDVKIVEN